MDVATVHTSVSALQVTLGDNLSALIDHVCGQPSIGADSAAALAALRAPLRIAVRGRARTGRDTLCRAVREHFGVTPIGPGDDDSDADVWLYVMVGLPRASDRSAIAALPPERTVLVQGKVDTLPDDRATDELVERSSAQLSRSVTPVLGLQACASMSEDEFDFLIAMADRGESMPSMSSAFISGDRDERVLRIGLLRRLDQYGILIALDAIADARAAGHSPTREYVMAAVRNEGRMDTLVSPIEATMAHVIEHRRRTTAAVLDRDSTDRDSMDDRIGTDGGDSVEDLLRRVVHQLRSGSGVTR